MEIHRPIPRRPFDMTPSSAASTESSYPSSPVLDPDLSAADMGSGSAETGASPSRSRSVLNLTSSTLLGIFSATGNEGTPLEMTTPWGTGAQTPTLAKSTDGYQPEQADVRWARGSSKPETTSRGRTSSGVRGYYVRVAAQTILLFAVGLGYGYLVSQLHKTGSITAVPVHASTQGSSYYLLFWGLFGVLLGNGLPLLDAFWDRQVEDEKTGGAVKRPSSEDQTDSAIKPLWYSAVRSIGAFVGIAFAVRRVPWTSTLQASLTLALANPVLWYLIDRSVTGFALSGFVGLAGTSILLLVRPGFVPVPAIYHDTASEQLGVCVWLASILFFTSLCFGAVGRKLQL